MHRYYYNNYSNFSTFGQPFSIGGLLSAGITGALITGATATASNFRKVQAGSQTRLEALGNVAKEAVGGGLAVAAGTAVARTLFRANPLGLLTMFVVSAGVKYLYDGLTSKSEPTTAPVKSTNS